MTALGTAVFVEIRGQKVKAVVVGTPFYKRVRKASAVKT
jgi:glycine cleavage system aminomethyltransferase T